MKKLGFRFPVNYSHRLPTITAGVTCATFNVLSYVKPVAVLAQAVLARAFSYVGVGGWEIHLSKRQVVKSRSHPPPLAASSGRGHEFHNNPADPNWLGRALQ